MLASSRFSIWAPSGAMLVRARMRNPLLPSPTELADYVESGHLRVMARKWWFIDRERRNKHRWWAARWFDALDDRLCGIWREDVGCGRTGTTARVLVVEDEDGTRWAEEQVQKRGLDVAGFVKNMRGNRVPAAWKEKLQSAQSDAARAQCMLRDMRNHARAFQDSGADRFLGTPVDAVAMERAAVLVTTDPCDTVSADPVRACDNLVKAVASLITRIVKTGGPAKSAAESRARTRAVLADDDELKKLRKLVTDIDQATVGLPSNVIEPDLSQRLAKQIEDGRARRHLMDYVKWGSAIDGVLDLANIATIAAACATGSPLAPVGMTVFGIRKARPLLERLGWITEGYNGPRWPFYLAYGSRNVRRKRREKLMHALTRRSMQRH